FSSSYITIFKFKDKIIKSKFKVFQFSSCYNYSDSFPLAFWKSTAKDKNKKLYHMMELLK
ncbi:hypothetical protein ACOWKN_06545, partial [Helicobacter pylori]